MKIRLGPSDCKSGPVLNAKTALSIKEQEKGLSERHEPIKKDEAMIFLYNTPKPQIFWMKNTYIPLSIFFFDSKGKLISAREMPVERDPANPRTLYQESHPAIAAVETYAGATRDFNLNSLFLCIGS